MPTVLRYKNILLMIHTRDHIPPHVTAFAGTPDNHEAKARIELATCEVIDSFGFSLKALKVLCELTKKYQIDWKKVWDETREG